MLKETGRWWNGWVGKLGNRKGCSERDMRERGGHRDRGRSMWRTCWRSRSAITFFLTGIHPPLASFSHLFLHRAKTLPLSLLHATPPPPPPSSHYWQHPTKKNKKQKTDNLFKIRPLIFRACLGLAHWIIQDAWKMFTQTSNKCHRNDRNTSPVHAECGTYIQWGFLCGIMGNVGQIWTKFAAIMSS